MTSKIIAFVLAIAVCVLIYFLWKGNTDYNGLIKLSKEKDDTAHYWKDQFGHEHVTLAQTQMSSAAAAVLHGKELDSLGKLFKTKANNIKEVTNYKEAVSINVKPQKVDTQYYPRFWVKGDTSKNADTSKKVLSPLRIRSLTGTFTDPWLNASATLGDVNVFKVQVIDTTGYTRYVKGFFNPKMYLDITHRAPYIHSYDIKSYEVQDPTSRIEVVLFGGAGYPVTNLNFKSPQAVFGIGLGYRLFSVKK